MVSSSSEELYVNLLHTGLSSGSLVLCGVTGIGLKEAFLMLETWWILDVFQRGVGMLKFSEPLLEPSSSDASLLSNVAFNVVTKQPNNISSEC